MMGQNGHSEGRSCLIEGGSTMPSAVETQGSQRPMTERSYTVLLYSDDPQVRDRMRLAIGTRPAKGLTVRFVESSTYAETVRTVDDSDIDLLVLDGEATPTGGIGIARQLKDEVADAPPTCVV